jgi:hypothetical protein
MNRTRFVENAKSFYLLGLLILLFGIIHIDTFYNFVDYLIIGLGLLIVGLGIIETLKSI